MKNKLAGVVNETKKTHEIVTKKMCSQAEAVAEDLSYLSEFDTC